MQGGQLPPGPLYCRFHEVVMRSIAYCVAHLKACNAIGDTPHDDLVKAAVERAWRKLTPLHIEALCREIQHNWKKSKDMPKKAGPSSEELQEIIRQSKLTPGARGAEERAKKGRVA